MTSWTLSSAELRPAELAWVQLLRWIGLDARKFRDWRARYGKANEHNHLVPRDHGLEEWERELTVRSRIRHRTDNQKSMTKST